MEFEQLIYEEKDRIARITLNRPNVLNALSMQLSSELVASIELIRQSKKIKFVVIKGAGNNFCGVIRVMINFCDTTSNSFRVIINSETVGW